MPCHGQPKPHALTSDHSSRPLLRKTWRQEDELARIEHGVVQLGIWSALKSIELRIRDRRVVALRHVARRERARRTVEA